MSMTRNKIVPGLLAVLTIAALLLAGCATPALTTPTTSTTQSVGIFPRAGATVDLDWPILLLYADVNSLHIGARSEKYRVGWYVNGKFVSSEPSLTAPPFLNAIGNQEGTYTISLTVWDKLTGALVGNAEATVIAKKDKPILVVNHWVSATPGNGMRYWDVVSEGAGWLQCDVDLRLEGSTGTLALTLTAANVPLWAIQDQIGVKVVYPIENLKDDGTTIDFIIRLSDEAPGTFQLTRTPDGHLKGSYHYVTIGGQVIKGEGGMPDAVSIGGDKWEGTLDLVPAP